MKRIDRLFERFYVLLMAFMHLGLAAFLGRTLNEVSTDMGLTAFEWSVLIALALIFGRLEASAPLDPFGLEKDS